MSEKQYYQRIYLSSERICLCMINCVIDSWLILMLNQEKAWKDLLLLCTEQHRVSSNREKHPMWMLLFSPPSLSALLSPSHTLSLSLLPQRDNQWISPKAEDPSPPTPKGKECRSMKCPNVLPLYHFSLSMDLCSKMAISSLGCSFWLWFFWLQDLAHCSSFSLLLGKQWLDHVVDVEQWRQKLEWYRNIKIQFDVPFWDDSPQIEFAIDRVFS